MSLVFVLLGALRAALRTRTDLTLENLALRQQLALLRRRSKRPQFERLDRLLWVWLSNQWAGWREALHLVRPDTVIRWHRQGFHAFWAWKSRRGRTGRPRVGSELADLVRTMAPSSSPAQLLSLLPHLAHTPRSRQGRAGTARPRATRLRTCRRSSAGRRTTPSLRPPRGVAPRAVSPHLPHRKRARFIARPKGHWRPATRDVAGASSSQPQRQLRSEIAPTRPSPAAPGVVGSSFGQRQGLSASPPAPPLR